MGCCGGSSSTADDSKPEPSTFFFKKRGCTDLCCLLFALIYMVGMGYVTYLGVAVGSPLAVFYGSDYLGNRCGTGTMASKPKVFYPRMDQDLLAQAALAATMPWRVTFYGLCMEACPNVTTPTACFADPSSCTVTDYGTPAQIAAAGGSSTYFATMPSLDFMNRCIPKDSSSLNQAPDRCAFPQCDGVNYKPCDTTYPTTWQMTFPDTLKCKVIFRVGEIQQMRPAAQSTVTSAMGKNVATVQRIVTGIANAWRELLLFGVALPIVLGFVWLVLLRFFAGLFTYLMIVGIGALMLLLALYLYVRAGAINALMAALQGNSTVLANSGNTSSVAAMASSTAANVLGFVNSATTSVAALAPSSLSNSVATAQNEVPALWWILAITTTVIWLIYVLSMCMARKQIATAVALVKEGSSVIADRPMTMFFPFNTLVAILLVFVYFVLMICFLGTANLSAKNLPPFSGAFLSAASSYLQSMAYYNTTYSGQTTVAVDNSGMWVNLAVYSYLTFGCLWLLASCMNIGWCAMSGSISHWFFFRPSVDPDGDNKTKIPLTRSLGRVLKYHLGTIFFGSFIIAVIWFIRIVLMIIDRYTKKQQKSNFLLYLVIKCTQCCMWCLEKTIKFITNYCYIYVAMQGSGFCKACFLTFSLIVNNPGQLAINTFVRTILSWIQLLALPISAGWLCNLYLVNVSKRTETIWATVVAAISAYIIAKVFTLVFSCVLDTLFVCCCRDKADYKGKFMPDRLKKQFGFKKKSKKEKEAEAAAAADDDEEEEEEKADVK